MALARKPVTRTAASPFESRVKPEKRPPVCTETSTNNPCQTAIQYVWATFRNRPDQKTKISLSREWENPKYRQNSTTGKISAYAKLSWSHFALIFPTVTIRTTLLDVWLTNPKPQEHSWLIETRTWVRDVKMNNPAKPTAEHRPIWTISYYAQRAALEEPSNFHKDSGIGKVSLRPGLGFSGTPRIDAISQSNFQLRGKTQQQIRSSMFPSHRKKSRDTKPTDHEVAIVKNELDSEETAKQTQTRSKLDGRGWHTPAIAAGALIVLIRFAPSNCKIDPEPKSELWHRKSSSSKVFSSLSVATDREPLSPRALSFYIQRLRCERSLKRTADFVSLQLHLLHGIAKSEEVFYLYLVTGKMYSLVRFHNL